MIIYKDEVLNYLNIPSIPLKEWNGKDSFESGVAVVNMYGGVQGYAVCSFDDECDTTPRITKVFGIERFDSIEKVYVVPFYMDNNIADADLDSESKRRAEMLAAEVDALEKEGTVDESIENANKLPEWIFPEIGNKEQAIAYLKEYNRMNGIKKGKIPSNEETIKMRLYNIYMSNIKRK